jgi:succinate-semialdehyde dehydrogenase / glutarate-semialdehyde dehydrogenase
LFFRTSRDEKEKLNMEFAPEGPKAIPLWINGHAFLTVSEAFFEVVNPLTGEALRRVPLCGPAEAAEAVAAARNAQPAWLALAPAARQVFLAALADALDGYAGHFAQLLQAEAGCDEAQALAEVAAAVAALRSEAAGEGGVLAVVVDDSRPLAGFAAAAAPALRAGATLVLKPSPKAPSALFALCELASRSGLPAGVLNLMQGDSAAIDGLCRAASDRLLYVGNAALGARVCAIAEAAGKPCVMVAD